jgi:hypothetical protein
MQVHSANLTNPDDGLKITDLTDSGSIKVSWKTNGGGTVIIKKEKIFPDHIDANTGELPYRSKIVLCNRFGGEPRSHSVYHDTGY